MSRLGWPAAGEGGRILVHPVISGLVVEAFKDANATVNYHKDRQGEFSNPPVEAPNDLQEIIKLIR